MEIQISLINVNGDEAMTINHLDSNGKPKTSFAINVTGENDCCSSIVLDSVEFNDKIEIATYTVAKSFTVAHAENVTQTDTTNETAQTETNTEVLTNTDASASVDGAGDTASNA